MTGTLTYKERTDIESRRFQTHKGHHDGGDSIHAEGGRIVLFHLHLYYRFIPKRCVLLPVKSTFFRLLQCRRSAKLQRVNCNNVLAGLKSAWTPHHALVQCARPASNTLGRIHT